MLRRSQETFQCTHLMGNAGFRGVECTEYSCSMGKATKLSVLVGEGGVLNVR